MQFDPERYARYLVPSGLALAVLGLSIGGPIMWVCLTLAFALLILSAYSREDGLLLIGPFVRHDLTMFARRYRLALWRSIYAGMLLGILAWVYGLYMVNSTGSLWNGTLSIRQLADFAALFFGTFMTIQALTIVTLAPGFLSEVIAEEKDRNRLDFLLVTDLRNHEIVLGKIASRLAYLFSIVLVGLPVLALLPLLGGVDPPIVFTLSIATGATLLGITGLAIFCSVLARTASQAVGAVFGLALLYLVFSGALWFLMIYPDITMQPIISWGTSSVRLLDLIEWANFGNPISMGIMVGIDSSSGRSLEMILDERVRQYTCFHLLVLAIFGLTGTSMLRRVAANQAGGPISRPKTSTSNDQPATKVLGQRPPMTDRPVLWMELHFNNSRPKTKFQMFLFGLLGLFALAPIVALIWCRLANEFPVFVNLYVSGITAFIATVVLTDTAQTGMRSVARERDKGTYESLILTGMGTDEILTQKWLGVYARSRMVFYWLIVNWIVAVALGYLHWIAIPLMGVAILVFQAFATSLGIWVSVRSATVRKANKLLMWYIVGVVLLTDSTIALSKLVVLIVTESPPAVISALGLPDESISNLKTMLIVAVAIGCFLGIGLYGFLAKWFWHRALERFSRPPQQEEMPTEPKAHLS